MIPNLNVVMDTHGEIYLEFTHVKPLIQKWKKTAREYDDYGYHFRKEKERTFHCIVFGILKHPVYGFFTNFFIDNDIGRGYRKGAD